MVIIASRTPSYKQPIACIVAACSSSSRKSSANRLLFQPDNVQSSFLPKKAVTNETALNQCISFISDNFKCH